MQRSSATVVALVGPGSGDVVPALAAAGRVRAVPVDPTLPALDRAVAAQRGAAGGGSALAVHDADPLADVAEAWARRYDGVGGAGELEIAVAAVRARWRAGSVELPDYYVVLEPEAWAPTRRHLYLGHLAGQAPTRVLPAADAEQVVAVLRRLPAGRWWPDLGRLLDGLDQVVPDALARSTEVTPGRETGLLRP